MLVQCWSNIELTSAQRLVPAGIQSVDMAARRVKCCGRCRGRGQQ